MAYKQLEQVRRWHEKFNVPVLTFSQIPSSDRINLRNRLIEEECWEFRKAVKDGVFNLSGLSDVQLMCNVMKEAADVIYVVHGTILEFGLFNSFEAAFDEVHNSNMTKTVGNIRDDGKILKGNTYVEPNLKKLFI